MLKRKPNSLKRGGPIKKKPVTQEVKDERKAQAERMWALFEEHWNTRPRRCESCGAILYGENKSLYHHHCWPKSKYPEYALTISNLLMVCGNCHANIENGKMTEETRNKIEEIKRKVVHS